MSTSRFHLGKITAALFTLVTLPGCGFMARGGLGGAFHTAGPIAIEANGALGAGISAGKETAILATAKGSVGASVRGAGLAGSGAGGIEYLISPDPWGGRVGVAAGYRGDEDGGNPFVQLEGGVSRAFSDGSSLDQSQRGAVSLGVFLGKAFASVKPPYPAGTLVGVAVSIEIDVMNNFNIPVRLP